ncbi:hypothetical protein L211DRAFT_838194 [Terfezia boudieri ATCC MYA-4762]|uniref:Uncharacterized protein n=1 Tax=Terfezia boudieri ATCC MYA-4762 TaxID=1051890 RepID=A0A3N4LLF8_9PEZI|nr:hypothetical protein L211DRAFT_838194 [Terfezia boudieri ATCC MYA-4762]
MGFVGLAFWGWGFSNLSTLWRTRTQRPLTSASAVLYGTALHTILHWDWRRYVDIRPRRTLRSRDSDCVYLYSTPHRWFPWWLGRRNNIGLIFHREK